MIKYHHTTKIRQAIAILTVVAALAGLVRIVTFPVDSEHKKLNKPLLVLAPSIAIASSVYYLGRSRRD